MKTGIAIVIFGLSLFNSSAQGLKTILPDYAKVQHAGSIGYMSAGAGYEFLKNWVNAEAMYGFVPSRFGGPLNIVTGRVIVNPFPVKLSQTLTLTPLNISGFVTYHFGSQFYVTLPSYYYEGYYKWSSAIRYHAGFGSMIAYKGKNSGHGVALYYELNTNDLYWKSMRTNNSISFGDILSLGFGIKIY